VLAHLAEHPTWGSRRAVRLSLVGNPRTPIATALRLIEGLSREDLERILHDDQIPRIVRVGAERRLGSAAVPVRQARRG
jgi:hypothetical protein